MRTTPADLNVFARCLALLLVLLPGGCSKPDPGGARPNVLILVADDLTRQAVSSFGGGYSLTPNLDRLAGEGLRFTRAVVSSPLCTPSRQSFLTGRWPHAIGVTQLNSTLPPTSLTLGRVFRDAGYATAAIGKMHWYRKRSSGADFGFDHIVDKKDWQAQLDEAESKVNAARLQSWQHFAISREARFNLAGEPLRIAEARQQAAYFVDELVGFLDEERDRPFLAFCSFYEPHAPFTFPESFTDRVDPADVRPPEYDLNELRQKAPAIHAHRLSQLEKYGPLSEKDLRRFTASYLRSVAWLDRQLGRVLEALAERGLRENTIVVFWSDHGYFLGEHGLTGKGFPFAEALETPLVLAGPGIEAGVHGELVQLLDVFPTLCELASIAPPEGLDGVTLGPAIRDGTATREWVFSELVGNWAAAQTPEWKLVLGSDPSKGLDQLYDLREDPAERTNRFGDESLRPIVDELIERMYGELRSSPPDWIDEAEWMGEERHEDAVRRALARLRPGAGAAGDD